MSATLAVVVAAAVILVTAAGVIMMFQTSAGELGEWIDTETGEADCYGLQTQYQGGNDEALAEAESEGCQWADEVDD